MLRVYYSNMLCGIVHMFLWLQLSVSFYKTLPGPLNPLSCFMKKELCTGIRYSVLHGHWMPNCELTLMSSCVLTMGPQLYTDIGLVLNTQCALIFKAQLFTGWHARFALMFDAQLCTGFGYTDVHWHWTVIECSAVRSCWMPAVHCPGVLLLLT